MASAGFAAFLVYRHRSRPGLNTRTVAAWKAQAHQGTGFPPGLAASDPFETLPPPLRLTIPSRCSHASDGDRQPCGAHDPVALKLYPNPVRRLSQGYEVEYSPPAPQSIDGMIVRPNFRVHRAGEIECRGG